MKMKVTKRGILGASAAAVAALTLNLTAPASPAQAAFNGCPYPYVCVWNNMAGEGAPVAMYRDITDYFQSVAPRSPFSVLNTRHDDVVYVRTVSGSNQTTVCLTSDAEIYNVMSGTTTITGIRISDNSHC
ncbi:hypothetical protein ACFU6R_17945 [Streptomyces sp. NPDC057499]|uniref:hypothetical protein n=1 Tax=Streptomyces sp. NPDC057499 TaxID=3346150 RepID=UPI00367E0846